MVEKRSYLSTYGQILLVGATYLFLYLPIGVLVLFSFNEAPVSFMFQGFSLRWYESLFANVELLAALTTSLIVAACTTLLSVSMGLMVVVGSIWYRSQRFIPLLYANILLPDIIIGVGLLMIFSLLKIQLGYITLIAAHTVVGLGFCLPIFKARLSDFDYTLVEASLDLGASYFQTGRKVILPLLMPALLSAALLVFTLSLDDFILSFFCSGPQIETLSVYIYYQIRTFVDPSINAVSTLILLAGSLTIGILCYFSLIDTKVFYE